MTCWTSAWLTPARRTPTVECHFCAARITAPMAGTRVSPTGGGAGRRPAMIHWLIDAALRNRFLIIAGFVLVAGWGYWALQTVPIDAIPDLSDNQVIVFTDWPGRSPQEVEDQITYPLTVRLQGLHGVRFVRSS